MIAAIVLASILTSTASFEAWISAEVLGRGHLPALGTLLATADVELALDAGASADEWQADVRHRAWIPSFEARFGTDRSLDVRDATTTSWVRTGQGLGLQIRLRWSLADALFNDSVLRVDKALRDRRSARWKARDRLVDLYFDRLELEIQLLEQPTPETTLRAARIDGLLQAVSGGRLRFGTRATNPWPGRGR